MTGLRLGLEGFGTKGLGLGLDNLPKKTGRSILSADRLTKHAMRTMKRRRERSSCERPERQLEDLSQNDKNEIGTDTFPPKILGSFWS